MSSPIAVLGAGSFGTCLARLCGRDHEVALWARSEEIASGINATGHNPRYLEEITLPKSVHATSDLAKAVTGRELVIISVPSHGVRDVVATAAPYLDPGAILVITSKGIEAETGLTMSEVLMDVLDSSFHPRIVLLSGPSFAREIAEEQPTAVTVACRDETYAISVQAELSCPWFRCYSHDDVIGVEIGGAVKNIVAIAVGICEGLGMGLNTRAALMTRGLREMTRLGETLGANPLTFQGLSGMGDLLLTCTGDLSRNRNVGLQLGRGRSLSEITLGMGQIAEGVKTTLAVCQLADRLEVEMPIAQAVRLVLTDEISALEAGSEMLSRQLRAELD